jgi:aminopeptidase-like protein
MNPAPLSAGAALQAFAAELYPICRSITGAGVRKTLRLINHRIDLDWHEVPSGTRVFDWEVPLEWNIEDAWVADSDGRRVVDFNAHNLHILNYSEPVRTSMPLEELKSRLHSIPAHEDWIPYRTSYYRRQWGFCLRHRELQRLRPGKYEIVVDSSLAPGALTYAECVLPGRSKDEVLFFTHICHPSLANDNTSGMAVATALAAWIAAAPRRYSYRLVFAPGTIGSLCWLQRNQQRLGRVRHGLVLGLLADPAPFTYKRSRRGDCEIDRLVEYVTRGIDPQTRVIDFEPYGYDERQLCSPGFNLPVGRLTRSVNDGYPEYHSSADDLALMSAGRLEQSLEACKQVVEVLESNRRYINLSPKGEPRLGKRGLYGAVGGRSPADRERAMLWVLNQSDGGASLLDIAQRSGISFPAIKLVADELEQARLLRATDAAKPGRAPASRAARPAVRPAATSKARKSAPARAGRRRRPDIRSPGRRK